MPRVKPLIRPDPIEIEVASTIGTIRTLGRLSIKDLAKRAGIDPATLGTRIGKNGDIGSLRLREYLAILRVGEDIGVIEKGR